jgi:hypothetical protein
MNRREILIGGGAAVVSAAVTDVSADTHEYYKALINKASVLVPIRRAAAFRVERENLTPKHAFAWTYQLEGTHGVVTDFLVFIDKGPSWPTVEIGEVYGFVSIRMHDGSTRRLAEQIVEGPNEYVTALSFAIRHATTNPVEAIESLSIILYRDPASPWHNIGMWSGEYF